MRGCRGCNRCHGSSPDTLQKGRVKGEGRKAGESIWEEPVTPVTACDSNAERIGNAEGGRGSDFAGLFDPTTVRQSFSHVHIIQRVDICYNYLEGKNMSSRVRLPCGHYLKEEAVLQLAARIVVSRRETPGGGARPGAGRPKKIVACEKCGESGGTAEMRAHKCESATATKE